MTLLRALNVNVVRHPQNKGYGQALKTGIAAASYDLIAITDADCTYPVEYIPQLIGDIDKGFDMAVGRRTGPQYWESAFKSPLRYILKYLVEFTAGAKILDINSGLRGFKKSTVTPFLPHLCNTFSFTTSLTLAYMMSGKFVSYIDIPYEKRVGKSKVRLFKDSLTTLQYIVQAIVFYNPIKLFLVFSLSLWAFTALTATILPNCRCLCKRYIWWYWIVFRIYGFFIWAHFRVPTAIRDA